MNSKISGWMASMKTFDIQESELEKKELRNEVDFRNDQFCLVVSWPRLYWLVGRMYFAVVKNIVLSKLKSRLIRKQQLVSSAYETAYQPSNEDYARHRDLRRDIFLVRKRPVYTDGWYIIKNYSQLLLKTIN